MPLCKNSDKPKPGDLIEIFRTGYQHWALYIGNGYIIHLAPPGEYACAGSSSLMSVFTEKAVVCRDHLEEVAGNDMYRVNNKYDSRSNPLPVYIIIANAKEQIGEELPYSIVSYNCEHFVTSLRYEDKKSDQVTSAFATAAAVGGMLALFGVAAYMGMSHKKKRRQDERW
ncbi:phospholipase A and acyltransferase 2-like [Protopterus annectens]|uniref:phospholipase A and acyltransferase 2-like n=1 Tax=Protopterus annectens TaxID=7888 RepID=UPI001CF9988A|nr:phospholipase A and acyltransferase 2-like [Protopterus annectens]